MRRIGLVLRLSLALEGLAERVRPRFRPVLHQFRRYDEVRAPLDLETPYYPAQGEHGYVLIPKDRYMAEVESLLSETI